MIKTVIYILFIASIANAKVFVITSQDSKVDEATKQELSNVYLKKTDEIKGEKVEVLINKEHYKEFSKKVLDKTPSQIHAYWMKQVFLGKKIPPRVIKELEMVKEFKNNSKAITYAPKDLDEKVIYETK